MSESDLVLFTRDAGLARVTLNRPEALNALSAALRARLVEVLRELATDAETEVVILTGAGRAFCVGLDLKELGGETNAAPTVTAEELSDAFRDLGKPLIGAVNGYAITGGFELALMCDFLVASPAARFADTHARVGVVPGWGLSQRLPRMIGINRAKELSLTGNYLDAETAERWGLVNRVVPANDLIGHCERLARDILSTDRTTRDAILRVMEAGWGMTLAEGLALERQASRAHAAREVSADKVAARRAAIQARGRAQSAS
ncbi:MAG: enoyl-CoA hydratase [Gammaproteobacteria bacterium]|nr:enoyl-CoA hydratase [Gammaproteobacteria bacterium]MCP5202256.1 enoyl-CoA hydratase [Gammaproteobacteria bacterium]